MSTESILKPTSAPLAPLINPPAGKPNRPRILISDDQHDILTALELLLKMRGYETQRSDTPNQVLRLASEQRFDLILMDLNYTRDTTSGHEGLDLLSKLRPLNIPIVVMTAWSSVDLAVEAMRIGAADFVQKPWDNVRLLQTLSRELERSAEARSAAAQSRSEAEIARHVHQKLFPQNLKKIDKLDYAGRCISAREVGGDYFDFFDLEMDRLAFVIADVSGKGVAAAMLMANFQASLRTQFQDGVRDPLQLLRNANRLFFDSTPESQYLTLFYGEFCALTRELRYLNCGHPAPVLVHQNAIVRLEATATVLGLFPEWPSASMTSVRLDPGDVMVAFTDGITDELQEDGSDFGENRLLEAILEVMTSLQPAVPDSQAWVELLLKKTSAGAGQEAFDDRTIVVLQSAKDAGARQ